MEVLANQVNLVCNDLVALARSRPAAFLLGVRDMFALGRFSPLAPSEKLPFGACRPHRAEAETVSYESDRALHV
jgi:hypothetical protein